MNHNSHPTLNQPMERTPPRYALRRRSSARYMSLRKKPMSIDRANFDAIDEADLHELVTAQAPENVRLEYLKKKRISVLMKPESPRRGPQ